MRTAERFPISADDIEECITILLIEDTIVETNEIFLVQLEQIVSSDDLIFKPNPEYVEVTIRNNDGMIPHLFTFRSLFSYLLTDFFFSRNTNGI